MSKLFVFLFGILCVSCSEKESGSEIYFFQQKEMTVIIPLNCSDLVNRRGLKKIPFLSEDVSTLLREEILTDTINSYQTDIVPDVRYKVVLGSDTICIGYNGRYITNTQRRGKISQMNIIEDFISKNKDVAIQVGKPLNEPWEQ